MMTLIHLNWFCKKEHYPYLFIKYFSWNIYKYKYTRCLKIGEFRIQSVVGKDPVEFEKYSLFLKKI
jgi:hypothetical protein